MDLTSTANYQTFYYQLHAVDNDKINTNGITDILLISDTEVLVMERAYIPNQGNVVRLYQVKLASGTSGANCDEQRVVPFESSLVYDFNDVKDFNIDNAEGMTFNADRSMLYIITDNNFSKKQETQLIALKVKWD